jgi:hypothetical protein
MKNTYLEITDKLIDSLLKDGLFNYQFLKTSQERGYVISLTRKNTRKVQYEVVDLEFDDIQNEAKRYKWLNDFAKENDLLYLTAMRKNLIDELKNMYGEPLVKKSPWWKL